MSNGQTCFQVEDRAPSGGPEASPPASGVRTTRASIAVASARSAVTMPGAGVDRFAETLPVVDEVSPDRDVEWCVDLGERLTTRSTLGLWKSIGCGEVGGSMLVWREGMECWTPIDQVGELACALDATAPIAPGPTPDATEATTNPELSQRPPAPEAAPPRSSRRRRAAAREGKWVGLGSAVVASAIAAATLTLFLAPLPVAEPSVAPPPAAVLAPPGAVVPVTADVPAPIDPVPIQPVPAATPSPKVRHEDRGQHRRRGGERR